MVQCFLLLLMEELVVVTWCFTSLSDNPSYSWTRSYNPTPHSRGHQPQRGLGCASWSIRVHSACWWPHHFFFHPVPGYRSWEFSPGLSGLYPGLRWWLMLRSASKASNPAVGWAQLLSFAGGSPFGLGVLNILSWKNIRWYHHPINQPVWYV